MWTTIREAERLGIVGGRTYDALIARAAVKAGASTLLTRNVRDFSTFAQEVRIETPRPLVLDGPSSLAGAHGGKAFCLP